MAAGRPRKFDYDEALDRAMRVFWEKGYEGTSMPDLTDAMQMNRPSIYAAYGNKEELFCKALERYTDQAVAFFKERLDQPTLKEAVSAFLCGAVKSFSCDENPKGCLSVQGALACSEEAKVARQQAIFRREKIVEVLQERFDKAVNEGELSKKTDTKELARFFITIVQGLSVQSASGVSHDELKSIAQRSLAVLPIA